MGTVVVAAGTVTPAGSWTIVGNLYNTGGATVVFPPTAGSYNLTCSPGSTILIDGVAKSINQLPVGFHNTGLNLVATGIITNTGGTHFSVLRLVYDQITQYSDPTFSGALTKNISVESTGASILKLFTVQWAYQSTVDGDVNGLSQFTTLYLNGTYNILSYSWTIQNQATPINAGDPITITSNGIDIPLNQITSAKVIDSNQKSVSITNFTTQNTTTLSFSMPTGLFPGTITIILTGNGTTYSGEAVVGNITLADRTGLYTLTPNQYHDTLYDHAGSTVNVAIPNPRAELGFIGG